MRPDIATDIAREIERARRIHGRSIETGDNGYRLAILTEEVGEVARAMCELALAEKRRDEVSRTGTTEELERARRDVEVARCQIFAELVQVAASAARWLEVRG